MHVFEVVFECFEDTTIAAVDVAINRLLELWRYNGQVIGREFPLVLGEGVFSVRLMCPEMESLHPKNHSLPVKKALSRLSEAGLLSPKVRHLGRDINSEVVAEESPSWQILYTTYVHSCSPLRSGDSFLPIPLTRISATGEADHTPLLRWQAQWQACDEIQMGGGCSAESAALAEIADPDSKLFAQGRQFCAQIEASSGIPTYYYQYRIATEGDDEQDRHCPCCQRPWRLDEAIHDIFAFKCDHCRLVSNLAWDQQ